MALSNWDILAFGVDGQPCEGWLENPSGNVRVEIFKNKVMVYKDARSLATIFQGEVEIEKFRIEAVHYEPQDAVFCFAHYHEFDNGRPVNLHMAGVGCYGYMDEIDWLKVNHPAEHQRVMGEIAKRNGQRIEAVYEDGGALEFAVRIPSGLGYSFEYIGIDPTIKPPTSEDLWVGIQPATIVAFRSWLTTVIDPDSPYIGESLKRWYRQVQASTSMRVGRGSPFPPQAPGTPSNPVES